MKIRALKQANLTVNLTGAEMFSYRTANGLV